MSSEKKTHLTIQVPKPLVEKLNARAKYLTGKLGVSVTRSEVARNILTEGLKDPNGGKR